MQVRVCHCACSVLAERRERILRLLPSVEPSREGRYVVRLFKDGLEREVTVDDHFPCIQAHATQVQATEGWVDESLTGLRTWQASAALWQTIDRSSLPTLSEVLCVLWSVWGGGAPCGVL